MKITFPETVSLNNVIYRNNTEEKDQEIKFGDFLASAIEKVDSLQKKADASAIALATGDAENLHNVMIDMEKAEIALQFTIQVRNKVLEAYQEIMRMQV